MNPTMNSQEHKTTRADMGSMVIGLQLDNIILRPNLKPKTTSHGQTKQHATFPYGNSLPLSVEPLLGKLLACHVHQRLRRSFLSSFACRNRKTNSPRSAVSCAADRKSTRLNSSH